MRFFGRPAKRRSPRVGLAPARVRLEVENLEARIVPYALGGAVWPHPEMVTISFVPDGTIVGTTSTGYAYSNLFAKMNARFGSPSVWEAEILRAAQSWAVQTNLNFDVVSDNGTPIGQGAYQQGDPGMGDIRIGGYGFTTTYLASAALPPPVNNYSIAGDIQFNTNDTWHIGSTYDLFSVAAHEMGHALGLLHSTTPSAVMYSSYNGVKSSLTSDDIAGIRANYSSGNPRTADSTSNSTIATATNISSLIDPVALTALVPTTDLSSTSDADYYTFTAPTGSSSTLTVAIQSAGLSMLTPSMTVYAADGVTVLGSASDAGHLGGNTLTVTVSGVSANQQFYVRVAGADSTVFSVGEYALSLNLGTGSLPTVPLPNTETLNGTILHGGGGQPEAGWSWEARLLSAWLGTTREVSTGMLSGSADADSASPQADAALDRMLALGNAAAGAPVSKPIVVIPGASYTMATPMPSVWVSAVLPLSVLSQPTWSTVPTGNADSLKLAITRVFAQADAQSDTTYDSSHNSADRNDGTSDAAAQTDEAVAFAEDALAD